MSWSLAPDKRVSILQSRCKLKQGELWVFQARVRFESLWKHSKLQLLLTDFSISTILLSESECHLKFVPPPTQEVKVI